MSTRKNESSPATGINRRNLIVGSAWSAPAIALAVAAPSASASPRCTTQEVRLNWGLATYTGSPSTTNSFTTSVTFSPTTTGNEFPPLTSPLTAIISHSWNGAQLGTSNNGRISTFNVGGIGQVGYGLYQQVGANARDTPTAADYQTIQFTFSEPLSDLSFSITDIDRTWAESRTRDFIDGVSLNSSSAFTSSSPSGSFVIGDGSSTSPWQNQNNGNYSENGPGGQIDINFTQPVTTFTITYSNLGRTAPNTNNDQAVFVTGFRTSRPTVC